MNMSVGGYLIVPGFGRKQMDILINPSASELDAQLVGFSRGWSGVLAAGEDPRPIVGPAKLALYAENSRYLLMLEDYDERGECAVRTLNNNSNSGLFPMLGELYPAAAMTTDFSLVCNLFKVFVQTGDLPRDLLAE